MDDYLKVLDEAERVKKMMDDFNSLKIWERFIDGEKQECRVDIIYPLKWELTSPKPIRL